VLKRQVSGEEDRRFLVESLFLKGLVANFAS